MAERAPGPAPEAMATAVSVWVSGRVQGVGFRYFAHERAIRMRLVGFVRNLRDGGVHVVAEGPRATLEAFASQLSRGPAGSRVSHTRIEWRPATGQYERFSIESTL